MRLISRVASSEWPPSAKKLSSIPTRSTPQHLGEQRAQDLLLRRARRAPPRSPSPPAPAAPPVELAVRGQRQPLQHDKRRRHHVVRQAAAPRARAAPPRPALDPRPPPRRRPAACRPAASSRATTAACATPGMPHQHRLDLARLDAETAQLHLRVRAPEELQHPVRHASAPGPRCGTSGFPPDRTGPRRTAPPSAPHAPDSRAQAPPPLCTAPPPPRRNRLKPPSSTYTRVFQIGRPIGGVSIPRSVDDRQGRPDRSFGRPV